MDEISDSCGSKQRSLSVSPKDKGSKNKRKSADPSMGNALNIPPSLTEFPRYELSPEVSQRSLSELMLELGLDRLEEGPEPEAFGSTDWDDPIAWQLEEILFSNLQVVFRCAIKQIAELGYSEEVAEKVVSRGGLYLEGKDPVVNIVNDTLYLMEERKDIHVLRDDMLDDLQQLVEYTMLEIIGVLREVRPSLSIGEAMWWLLICDLNVSQACALERDPLSDLGCKDVSGEGSSDSAIPQFRSEAQSSETLLPNPTEPKFPKLSLPKAKNSLPKTLNCESFPNLPKPEDLLSLEGVTPEEENLVSLTCTLKKSSGITRENVQIISQTYASEEKMGAGCKGQTKKELAALRQKCFNMDKSYRTYRSKGGFRSGKLTSFGGFVLERRLKPPSELPGVQMKNASSKKSTEVPADVPLADGSHPVKKSPSAVPAKEKTSKLGIKGTISMLPTAETKLPISSPLEKKSNPKPQVSVSEAPKIPDYYTGIPYENSLGKHVAQNEKDELILKLVPRLQELQDELQGWTEWANEKVMHAAHRLGKDQRELKALRLEKEEADQYKKEQQILEENTMKRLSEMENALGNATGQVEILNSTALRLEVGKSVLKRELDAAKLQALESAASYQEVVEREQMALKKAQSWEGQKVLLQEEHEREKCKVAELQQELDKAKNLHNQIEARWKLDRMTPEKLLTQAASIRQERELLEAQAKAEEEVIRQKAEGDLQKYMEDIEKLKINLSQMKFKSNSSTIAALRRGIGGSCGSVLTDSMDVQTMQRNPEPHVLKKVGNLQNSFRTQGLKQERECVICLSEEMSVVYLPCAHQVVCAKCNELHEKQGMKYCPSCMTPIQWRINVRFARPCSFTPISRNGEC